MIKNRIKLKNDTIFSMNENADFTEFIKTSYRNFNLSYLKFFKMDNLCKLGFVNFEILIKNSEILQKYDSKRIGIVLNNYSSSLDTDILHQQSINDKTSYFPSPSVFVYTLPNILIGEICIKHKIFGENLFTINKFENQDYNIDYINILFDNNIIDCCIAGTVDVYKENFKSILYIVEKNKNKELEIEFNNNNLKELYANL